MTDARTVPHPSATFPAARFSVARRARAGMMTALPRAPRATLSLTRLTNTQGEFP